MFYITNILQNGLVSARSRPVNQRVPRRTTVPIRYSTADKKFLEGLPKLTRHTAINGEIYRITENDEEIREQDQYMGDVVV